MRLALSLLFISLSLFAGRIYKDNIIAKVNGEIITNYDIQELSYREELRLRQIYREPELTSKIIDIRKKALNILIEEQLILDFFESNEAYQVPSSLLEERIEKSIARRFGSDRSKFYNMLDEKNMTIEEYRKEIERGIIIELMKMEFVRKKVIVTPHDIALYYADNKENFAPPSQIHIKMIILDKTKSGFVDKIVTLREKLKDDKNFTELMDKYSDSQFSGDLGFLNISDIRPDFLDSLQTKNVNEYAEIEEDKQVIFVSKVAEKKSQVPELETVHSDIKEILQTEQETKFNEEFIADLKKSAKIEQFVPWKKMNLSLRSKSMG